MKGIIISSDVLLQGMKELSKLKVKNDTVVPSILDYYIEFTPEKLILTRTDLNNFFTFETTDFEARESGSFMLSDKIIKLLQKSDLQPIVIKIKDHMNVELSGDNFTTSIETEPIDNYPKTPEVTGQVFTLNLREQLEKLSAFVSTDQLRPAMTGYYFDSEEHKIVATDGHKLKAVEQNSFDKSFILRPEVVKLLDKKVDSYKVTYSEYNVKIEFENKTIISRIIDGRFPNWKAVVPEDFTTIFDIDKDDLIKAVDKAILFANQTTHQIRLGINGNVKVSCEDLDFNSSFSETLNHHAKVGGDIEIGFNGKLLIECLKPYGKTVSFSLNNPNKAAIINEHKDEFTLLMPVMLNNYR